MVSPGSLRVQREGELIRDLRRDPENGSNGLNPARNWRDDRDSDVARPIPAKRAILRKTQSAGQQQLCWKAARKICSSRARAWFAVASEKIALQAPPHDAAHFPIEEREKGIAVKPPRPLAATKSCRRWHPASSDPRALV